MRSSTNTGQPRLSILEMIESAPGELAFSIVGGDVGLSRRFVTSERIQKLGLALAGFPDYVHSGRIQILGQSELSYLKKLTAEETSLAFSKLNADAICCILLTKGAPAPAQLESFVNKHNIPLLSTPLVSSRAIRLVTTFLEEALAPEITLHGVLLEMYGTGVMLLGNSGVGKSECALDLISRGHRLVSDDSVTIKRIGGRLVGAAPDLTKEHLEIRGLGVINIRELFGISALADKVQIELAIELSDWRETENIERLGLEVRNEEIFGISIGKFSLPVTAARNLAILVETAVRIYLSRRSGHDAARDLIERHSAMIATR